MLIKMSEARPTILWEGPLELESNTTAVHEGEANQGEHIKLRGGADDLPVVTIGKPDVWRLDELYKDKQIPIEIQTRQDKIDYYVVRLYCSFRSRRYVTNVVWARFSAELTTAAARRALPLAYDLYPDKVVQPIRRRTTVGLDLSLKFHQVEAKIAEATFGFEYEQLEPLVSAAGLGQSIATWDYERVKGIRLQGDKWMLLLVGADKGTRSARAVLQLNADVQRGPVRLPAVIPWFKTQRKAGIEAVLWGRGS